MLRATAIVRKLAVKAERIVDTVVLDHEERHRRRFTLTGLGGTEFLLDLQKPVPIKDGDALKLEDGGLVQVRAAPEALLEIRAENPTRLMRVAWHIGNRHTPAELGADALYIGVDHVLEEMVRGQGCLVTRVERPFEPERGAYEGGHGHDHGHHDHGHAHGNVHAHAEAHAHASSHVHGPGCGHDHDHNHNHADHAHAKAHHDHKHG